ncbi:MAG: citrate/2-methylcitrate synthase [Candidatus Heimdallarchaeaceae archaeon]
MTKDKLNAYEGLLFHFIKKIRPNLAEAIKETNTIETMIVGLGRQGTRHAKLMLEYGTNVTCGVAPGRGGTKVHEIIPVYNSAKEAIKNHPNIAVASIWKHYSTAKDATIEVIKAGVPIVVLISEFIPLKDVRDILVEARKNNTILFGGNTPGIIFPPEKIKVGMLPDIFQAEQKGDEVGPNGVTILSRSGAILYHMSDALASAGIAQNGVLGVGGDGAIGSRFIDLVPIIMQYEHTDLVVIAGEIGGMQEELLAQDMLQYPEKYPKPLVALISGANAPEGKTMGHAGAVITPGQNYGTYKSKKESLEKAGVVVVNHQIDLIEAVRSKLKRTYFDIKFYYKKMEKKWNAKPPEQTWGTVITRVVPNSLVIRGYSLQEIIKKKGLLETSILLVTGEFPRTEIKEELEQLAIQGAKEEFPNYKTHPLFSDVSKTIGTCLLLDTKLVEFLELNEDRAKIIAYTLGRVVKYLAINLGNLEKLERVLEKNVSFSEVIFTGLTGEEIAHTGESRLLEAIITACVDHGVTPPSTQTTMILASTRANFEVALSGGVQAITNVHGGAGQRAAEFFKKIVKEAKEKNSSLEDAAFQLISEIIKSGKRIEGLGHRIHTQDPRRDVLWKLAEETGYARECVSVSKMIGNVFFRAKGMNLPINVDGVIGAIIGDMELNPKLAKAVFVFGRIAGLAAHYYEEIDTQPAMRRIRFDKAVYKGPVSREIDE